MFVSPSIASHMVFGLTIFLLLYFIFMDFLLYSRVQNYLVRPMGREKPYVSTLPCEFDPFCVVTVKGLMLDYPNFYILSPMAAMFDHLIGISDWSWISPNLISCFHVFVAILAGKCVSSDSLLKRRVGVFLFEFRTWLDDLDGHVARKRLHISGERSDIGSTGYLVDGICDAFGCIALIVGIFFFLKRNPPRRGYEKLRHFLPYSEDRDYNTKVVYKSLRFRNMLRTILLVFGHLLVASIGWNRYIALYQDLLETDMTSSSIAIPELYERQSEIMRSGFFWAVVVSWRLINFHTAMDYLLIAIFVDRLWEYMRIFRWVGYVIVLIVVYLTEFHFFESYAYVLRGSTLLRIAASGSINESVVLTKGVK